MKNLKKIILLIFIILLTVLFDQVSKIMVLSGHASYNILTLSGLKFDIVKVWNAGISFGMFNNIQYAKDIFSLSTAIIVLILLYYFCTNNYSNYISLGMIIGGALGNLSDRILYGAVLDFIDFYFNEHHWPAFNIADISIFIGTVIYLYQNIKL